MLETSEQTEKLDEALAKAQGEIEPAAKDKTNPAFRSKYADLTSVWTACRSALAKHGLSVTQWPIHSDDGRLHLITRIAHGGQWMRATFSVPVDKANAHGYGSAMTYAKRYSLAACLGVVADDDDDGNTASQKPAQPVDVKAKAQAQNAAADALRAAVEAADPWPVWSLRVSQEEAYKAACSLLNTKERATVKELEGKGARMAGDYPIQLAELSKDGDEHGAAQLWDELTKLGKELVWADLDKPTREFIRNLKKEAA